MESIWIWHILSITNQKYGYIYIYKIYILSSYVIITKRYFQQLKKTKKERKDEEILKTSVDTEAFDDSKMSDNENPKLSLPFQLKMCTTSQSQGKDICREEVEAKQEN